MSAVLLLRHTLNVHLADLGSRMHVAFKRDIHEPMGIVDFCRSGNRGREIPLRREILLKRVLLIGKLIFYERRIERNIHRLQHLGIRERLRGPWKGNQPNLIYRG